MRPRRYFADQYEGNADPDMGAYASHGHVLYACKATEGTAHIDLKHAERSRLAHANGLTVLHYHYCRPDQRVPAVEAGAFRRAVRPVFANGDYLALDFEQLREGMTPRQATEYIEHLWKALHDASSHDALIYSSTSFLGAFVGADFLERRRPWEANYGGAVNLLPPRGGAWAHQATDSKAGPEPHELPGIGPCDVSVLNWRTALALSVRASRRRRALGK